MTRALRDRPRDRLGRPRRPGQAHELADHDAALAACVSTAEAFELGRACFETQHYFEAHEYFEWIWRADGIEAGERRFWRALAQVAAGCCHIQRGNRRGATAVLARARGELDRWPRAPRNIDAAALNDALGRLLDALHAGDVITGLDFPSMTMFHEK